MITKRQLLQALAGSPLVLGLPSARAQTGAAGWPDKPLRILVGFPPGSTPDLAARALSDGLAKALGQPVVVENKPGASGNIAADQVAKSTDEHTARDRHQRQPHRRQACINPATPFDPAHDFAPISLLTHRAARAHRRGHTRAAARRPNCCSGPARSATRATTARPATGTVGHLGMELLKSKTGIGAAHVQFQWQPGRW